MAMSPDNRWLVTSTDGRSVRRWDLKSASPAAGSVLLEGHTDAVDALAISADSRWLATGSSYDKTARLWDLTAPDPQLTSIVLRHDGAVSDLFFSPDGQWLVTHDNETKTAHLWHLGLDTLIKLACRTAGRNLTAKEWEQYFFGQLYRVTCSDLPSQAAKLPNASAAGGGRP